MNFQGKMNKEPLLKGRLFSCADSLPTLDRSLFNASPGMGPFAKPLGSGSDLASRKEFLPRFTSLAWQKFLATHNYPAAWTTGGGSSHPRISVQTVFGFTTRVTISMAEEREKKK